MISRSHTQDDRKELENNLKSIIEGAKKNMAKKEFCLELSFEANGNKRNIPKNVVITKITKIELKLLELSLLPSITFAFKFHICDSFIFPGNSLCLQPLALSHDERMNFVYGTLHDKQLLR